MNKITIRKKINPCFLSKNDLVGLAVISGDALQNEAKLAIRDNWKK